MALRTAVAIATKGRPQEVEKLLNALERQSLLPDLIVISGSDHADIPLKVDERVQVILGPPGLPIQRNKALAAVEGKAELVIFFDDDFVPSKFWIERAGKFLLSHPDVVCMSGRVDLDGITTGSIAWLEGRSVVDHADLLATPFSLGNCTIRENETPYGCNMALRADKLVGMTFDENLVLNGWLEDRDFGIRAAAAGRIVWTDAVWGVHLGSRSGRSSGLRFGYSQMVNPWYLMNKGVLTPRQAWQNIIKGLLSNTVGDIFLKSAVDRQGRLKGNLIGIKDIVFGVSAPARVEKL
jgi:hypothetical protein